MTLRSWLAGLGDTPFPTKPPTKPPRETPDGSRERPFPVHIPPARKTHNYKRVNPSGWSGDGNINNSMDVCLEDLSSRGWRLVAVISDNRPGWSDTFIFERPVGLAHPDD